MTRVVVPVEDFEKYMPARKDQRVKIPTAVIYKIVDGASEFRAWREHADLTQQEVADRMGKTRSAYAQNETPGRKHHRDTTEAFAGSSGVEFRHVLGSFDDESLYVAEPYCRPRSLRYSQSGRSHPISLIRKNPSLENATSCSVNWDHL